MAGNNGSRPVGDGTSVPYLPVTSPVEKDPIDPAATATSNAGPVADLGVALRGVLQPQPNAALSAAVRYAGSSPVWASPAAVGGDQPGPGVPGMELAGSITYTPDRARGTLKMVMDNMEPTPAMAGLPRWQDLVTIEQGADGIVFTAKSYVEGGEQKLSALKTFFTLPTTIKMARVAAAAIKQGDEITFNRIAALWGVALLHIAQIKVTVRGLEHLDPTKPYLFAPTHESMVEYGVHLLILNAFNLGYLLKDEFVKNPLLSSQFKGVIEAAPKRFIVVDRANKASGDAVVEAMAKAYADPANKVSLIVYPQGTRAKGRVNKHGKRVDGDLFAKGPLRAGVGRVVRRMQEMQELRGESVAPVEVVPITANGIGEVVAKGQFAAKINTPVVFVISPPQSHVLTAANKDTLVAEVVAGVEAEFRRFRTSPQTHPDLVRWPAKKYKVSLLKFADLDVLYSQASPLRSPLAGNGGTNDHRRQLNRFLDQFALAFYYIQVGDERGLQKWLRAHQVLESYLQKLTDWIPEEEIQGVFARTKYDLNTPTKKENPEGLPTWEAMRTQRVGWILIKDYGKRALTRVGTLGLSKPTTSVVPITYEQVPKDPLRFDDLKGLFATRHRDHRTSVEGLVAGQLDVQSANFISGWDAFMTRVGQSYQAFEEVLSAYVDDYEQAKHPSYATVSAAVYKLHQAVVASEFFKSIDKDLQLFSFYTLEAMAEYERLRGQNAPARETQHAQARYYRLRARGTRYRALNQIRNLLNTDPNTKTWVDKLKAMVFRPKIRRLQKIGHQAELVAELIIAGQSIPQRIAELDGVLAQLGKKLGPLAKALGKKPLSFTMIKYRELQQQRAYLADLQKSYHDQDLDLILKSLAGSSFDVIPSGDDRNIGTLFKEAPEVSAAYGTYQGEEKAWTQAYWADRKVWAVREMGLYQLGFEAEYKLHALEFELQLNRYDDLMAQARKHTTLSSEQEMRYRKARAVYELNFKDYLAVAEEMAKPGGGAANEPLRKKKEMVFLDWLRLQWTVADVFTEIKHPFAGKIQPLSLMFTDHVIRFLLNPAAKDMVGLKPFFDAFHSHICGDITYAAHKTGADPREMDKLAGRFGYDSLSRGVDDVKVLGAQVLAGALGQQSGQELFAKGFSILESDQAQEFGVVPRQVGYDFNHMAWNDLQIAALFYALGLGRTNQVHERANFEIFPWMGEVFRLADSVGFERANGGSGSLQKALSEYTDRGVSFLMFGNGTMRVAATPIPLWHDALGAFMPRPYAMGGNIGEAGVAARDARILLTPGWQHIPYNLGPDIGLTGGMGEKNFRTPYAISAGAQLGGTAWISLDEPIPAWGFPNDTEGLRDLGINLPEGSNGREVGRLARRLIAATTELGKLRAYLATLKTETNPKASTRPIRRDRAVRKAEVAQVSPLLGAEAIMGSVEPSVQAFAGPVIESGPVVASVADKPVAAEPVAVSDDVPLASDGGLVGDATFNPGAAVLGGGAVLRGHTAARSVATHFLH